VRPFFTPQGQNPRRSSRWHPEQFGAFGTVGAWESSSPSKTSAILTLSQISRLASRLTESRWSTNRSYCCSADCSVVVLSLFHGHGLIGVTLSTLASGGSVIVPPRFSASEFWKLFREHRATWYCAVPTIHQVLLERADGDGAPHSGPRFIRSCSAPLAPTILTKMENRFGAPVVEAYGMTEAAHQVASPPQQAVGRAFAVAAGDSRRRVGAPFFTLVPAEGTPLTHPLSKPPVPSSSRLSCARIRF
jgi:acyl-CoA synthetase (AMP-forming)/AMP-acid ligase II